MKIVMVSDTHGRHGSVVGMPKRADVLLHAGDFSFRGLPRELASFDAWLERVDCDHKVVVPGNHELSFEAAWEAAAKLVPSADAILDGALYDADGLSIWGEPRQPWFCDWAFNVEREDMREVWDRIPKGVDVLLTHGPPYGYGDLTVDGRHVGCEAQLEWIKEYQPMLVVCGHIHSGYGTYKIGQTTVVNASICDEGYRPSNHAVLIDL